MQHHDKSFQDRQLGLLQIHIAPQEIPQFPLVTLLSDIFPGGSGMHSDSSDNSDSNDLVLAAQEVVKAVEQLVPSGDGNSFSKWIESNETDN